MRLINPRTFVLKVTILIVVWFFPVVIPIGLREELVRAGHPSLAIGLIAVGVIVNLGWGVFLARRLSWSTMSKFLLPPPVTKLLLLYVYSHGQQCGPYSINQITQFATAGQFQWTDLAWYQEKWIPLSSLPGIGAHPAPLGFMAISSDRVDLKKKVAP